MSDWKMPEWMREILVLLYQDSIDLIELDKRWIPEHGYLLDESEVDETASVVWALKELRAAGLLLTPYEMQQAKCGNSRKRIAQLQAENERLKADNKRLRELLDTTYRILMYPSECFVVRATDLPMMQGLICDIDQALKGE